MTLKKQVSPGDYDILIDEDFILKDQKGDAIVVYNRLDVDFDVLHSMTKRVAQTGRRDIVDGELDYYYNLINPYLKKHFPKRPLFDKVYYSTNVEIGYHIDRIPSEKSLTCTLCSRHATEGGYIVIPELRIAFAQQHGFICMFDGRKYMHGVSKITKKAADAYRTVYVFYT